jgi:hypothetical protein
MAYLAARRLDLAGQSLRTALKADRNFPQRRQRPRRPGSDRKGTAGPEWQLRYLKTEAPQRGHPPAVQTRESANRGYGSA